MMFMYNIGEQKKISIIHLRYVNDVFNLLNAYYEQLLQRTWNFKKLDIVWLYLNYFYAVIW